MTTERLMPQPPLRVYDHVRTRVIVVHDGAMLLLPPDAGFGAWLPPGGGLEPGESLAECARREVREETGLDVRVGPVAFLQEWIGTEGREPGQDYDLHVFFYAEPVGDTVPRAEVPDHPAPEWVPLDRVPHLPLYPAELKYLAGELVRGAAPLAGSWARGVFEDPGMPPRPPAPA